MKQHWPGITLILLLLFSIVGFGLKLLSSYRRPQLAESRRQEILECLEEAHAIKVPLYDAYLVVRTGEPAFHQCIAMLKEAVLRGPEATFTGKPPPEALIIGRSDVECLKIGLYIRSVVIDGMCFQFHDADIPTLVGEAESRKIYHYPSGKKRAEGLHEKGKKHGPWIFFYETGQKMSQGRFVAGAKDGVWLTWDAAGNVLSKEEYKNGELLDGKR
jgi:hypothetical protein